MAAVPAAAEHAASLWPLLRARAARRKTLTHAEASAAVAGLDGESRAAAAWAVHAWCWVRGLPPLNVVLVPRGKTPDAGGGFASSDYDVVHEALGYRVYTLEEAWFYPWAKVPDPTPGQVGWALGVHAGLHALVRDFRRLDLELELRQRDEARGRKRPAPPPHASWRAVEDAHRAALGALAGHGIGAQDLRPPGKGPYPPPRPVIGNWAD
jgi:hypothetical protein